METDAVCVSKQEAALEVGKMGERAVASWLESAKYLAEGDERHNPEAPGWDLWKLAAPV